ncbi:MAG: hypothetical protein ABII80_02805 [bacterium]
MSKQEILSRKDNEINWEKVRRDFAFLRLLSELSYDNNWRMVVSGGYGLDAQLGRITRTHDDLDVIMYGVDSRDRAVKLLSELIQSKLIDPMISVKSEAFFENVDVSSSGFGANMYYVETVEDPNLNINKVRKLDGEVITNTEERFPSPVKGKLAELIVEVQNPNTHLADIIFKRRTQPHKPTHDQDIKNLELLTDSTVVESILGLV